jgi:hypothetical protein
MAIPYQIRIHYYATPTDPQVNPASGIPSSGFLPKTLDAGRQKTPAREFLIRLVHAIRRLHQPDFSFRTKSASERRTPNSERRAISHST